MQILSKINKDNIFDFESKFNKTEMIDVHNTSGKLRNRGANESQSTNTINTTGKYLFYLIFKAINFNALSYNNFRGFKTRTTSTEKNF